MTAKLYVTDRNGTFYYYRRVPTEVTRRPDAHAREFGSRPHFRRSLLTKDKATAYRRAAAVHEEFEGGVRRALAPISFVSSVPTPRRAITLLDLEAAQTHFRTVHYASFEDAFLRAETNPLAHDYFNARLDQIENDAEEISRVLNTPGATSKDPDFETPLTLARNVIQTYSLDAPNGSPAEAALVSRIRQGIREGITQAFDLRDGKRIPSGTPKKVTEPVSAAITLRDAVEQSLAERSLEPRTRTELCASLKAFEAIVGNKPLNALTVSDFRKFAERLGLTSIGGKTPGSLVRRANPQTVAKKLSLLRRCIGHAIDRGRFDGPNPVDGVKASAFCEKPDLSVMKEKRPFEIDELNKMFQHKRFSAPRPNSLAAAAAWLDDEDYWIPVVALFTGCRASELGGLKLDEVRLEGLHPHLVVQDNEYRRTKKGFSRSVPILDDLIDLGFADYIKRTRAKGVDRLFPDWKPKLTKGKFVKGEAAWSNAMPLRRFNERFIDRAIPELKTAVSRREATFHGFRGSFKTMLAFAGINMNIINDVMGHAKNGEDKSYLGRRMPLASTYPLVHHLRFAGLKVPARREPN